MSHIGVSPGFGNLHENLTDEQMYVGGVRIAGLADQLGFDSLWTVQHHFDDYSMCPDNVVFLAHAAGRTERVGLGTGAVIRPGCGGGGFGGLPYDQAAASLAGRAMCSSSQCL